MTDTTPARELVARALLPLLAVSDDLHASAVAYVLDSTDPQALPHIPAQSDVRRLLNNPGRIAPDVEMSAQMRRRLHAAGVSAPERHAGPEPGEPEEGSLVRSLRALLYLRGSLTPEQWERFGRLLIALGDAPNRCAAGVPEWLCGLLNDVAVTAAYARYMLPPGESEKRSAQELRERWSPTAVAALFEATGAPAEQVPAVILLAWIAEANGGYVYASAEEPKYCLPGIEDYLAAHDGQIPADALTALSARARADIAKRLGAHPQAAAGCPRFLAMLAVDSAATVRRAAIAVLDELPARARDAALVEQLATARTPRLKEAVTWLASTPAGERILEEVVAVNPAAARLARSLTERRDTLLAKADSERVPDVLDLPPFESALDVPSAASAKAVLRRRIAASIQELTGADAPYLKSQRYELEKITDDVLDRLMAIADGTSDEPLGIPTGPPISDQLLACPALPLLPLCRLQPPAADPSLTRLLYGDAAPRLAASAPKQCLSDCYFVLPRTINACRAHCFHLPKLDESSPAVKEALDSAQGRIDTLMSINGTRSVDSFHKELGKIMWEYCGMERTEEGLKKAIGMIRELRADYWKNVRVPGKSIGELNQSLEKAGRVADFMELGELMCIDALHREESCGGHFRAESQTPEGEALRHDDKFLYVAAWEFAGEDEPPILHKEDLIYNDIELKQRSYK